MPSSLRFCDEIELDVRAYELRRAGHPVKLERIPMEVLLLLVERRPELVTREEIVERIWGRDVFLDADNSINGAIRKIRHALGDNPDSPRFILTVTAKGYRFISPLVGESAAESAESVPSPQARRPEPVESIPSPPARGPDPIESVPLPPARGPEFEEIVPSQQGRRPEAPPRSSSARRWGIALVALLLIGVAGAYLQWAHPRSSRGQADRRLMLAVLPFENLTGDSGQDYFSDGFTEEMITRLGAIAPKRLGVIARTSVIYYRKAQAPLDRLGRDLGVQYVLEGSVRREFEQVRIAAQLIRVADQSQIWARQYDRAQTDVLRVQEEISEEIGDQVELALDRHPSASPHTSTLSPRNYAAYDEYLKGRHFWNLRSRDGFRSAIASFQKAIEANPDDARFYAGLADAYGLIGTYNYAPQAEVIPKAREAALKALEIDANLAEAHTSLALLNEFFDWDWQSAGDRFRRAIDLEPNYATAHHWYAEYLAFQGRFGEALDEIEHARKLDPQSTIIGADTGAILYFGRRYDRAIEQFHVVIAVDPGNGRAHMIVPTYIGQGRLAEARAEVSKWEAVEHGPWPLAYAAYLDGRTGRQTEARLELEKSEELSRSLGEDPLERRTLAYLGMGLDDEALSCLEQACRIRSNFLIALKVDPIYDPLRETPRFAEVLRRVGLEQVDAIGEKP